VVSLDAETLQKLLSLPNTKTFTGLRDYAPMPLTIDTGGGCHRKDCRMD